MRSYQELVAFNHSFPCCNYLTRIGKDLKKYLKMKGHQNLSWKVLENCPNFLKIIFLIYIHCYKLKFPVEIQQAEMKKHSGVFVTVSLSLVLSLMYTFIFFLSIQKGIYLTARGQDINRQPNILYISTDDARSWIALHEFVDVSTKRLNDFS